jgi:hypothetical protein
MDREPGNRETEDRETELIDVFERMVHQGFPNPERVDCPGSEHLRLLVEPSSHCQLFPLLDHVRRCAPCFDELKQMRKARACGH